MKKLQLVFQIYRHNPILILFLFCFITYSIFNMVDFMGCYAFDMYSFHRAEQMGLTQNGIYFMPTHKEQNTDAANYDDLLAQNFSAVEKVINPLGSYTVFRDSAVNVTICEPETRSFLRCEDEGMWLPEDDIQNADGSEKVVVSGYLFQNVQVGDKIELDVYNLRNRLIKSVTVEVIGKDTEPSYSLGLGSSMTSGNEGITWFDLFDSGSHNGIYLSEEAFQRIYDFTEVSNISYRMPNSLICFADCSSHQERQQVIEYAEQNGHYITFEDITAYSNIAAKRILLSDLPFPLFLLCISTFSTLAIATLFTEVQLKEYKIYYLCGCSRIRSYLNSFFAIGLIAAVAGVINAVYISIFPRIALELGVQHNKYMYYILEPRLIPAVFIYVLATLTISISIPFALIRKLNPVELQRR